MDIYDYIVVGAGSAGCVLANRLSARGTDRVLLLEAGGKDDGMWIDIPAGFSKLIAHPKYNWCFETEPEENVHNRRIPIPRGKALGGSSSINGMLYVRGQPLDYDTWAQQGNRGWSYESVLPYFRKAEHFEPGGGEARGKGGPLNVCNLIETHPLLDDFITAAEREDFPRNPDYNSGDQRVSAPGTGPPRPAAGPLGSPAGRPGTRRAVGLGRSASRRVGARRARQHL